jgi:hypothetical protein
VLVSARSSDVGLWQILLQKSATTTAGRRRGRGY